MTRPLGEGLSPSNVLTSLQAPVGGLNTIDALTVMRPSEAFDLENFLPYPDRVETRFGAANYVTGFANPVKGLWVYNGLTAQKLWATTDAGIYDATTAGAVGAAAIALTNGQTTASTISTGAATYLNVVNGTDTLKQYDGTTWSSIALFGTFDSTKIIGTEVYKQRLWFLEKNTLNLWYLGVNAVNGAATSYSLGAIFRRGGSVTGIATWTVDAGNGPDDHLVIATTAGEVAVFSGTDPSALATWSLKGVYYIGRPIGNNSLYKYGGEVLFICETGLYAISRGLLTASVDRTQAVSQKVRNLYADLFALYGANAGWQAINHPDVPFLLLNIPGTPTGYQLVMHSSTGAWTVFTGWQAKCWERMGNGLYFGMTDKVAKAWTGSSDFGNNIVSSMAGAFTALSYPRTKSIKMVRPIFRSNGAFDYTIGIANDLSSDHTASLVNSSLSSASLWGTGLWGTAIWTASERLGREWRVVPDLPGVYKSLTLQISSKTARAALLSTDILYTRGGTF